MAIPRSSTSRFSEDVRDSFRHRDELCKNIFAILKKRGAECRDPNVDVSGVWKKDSSKAIQPPHTPAQGSNYSDPALRTSFGLTYSKGSWHYEGANSQAATDLRSPEECAQVLRSVKAKLGFTEMCILHGRPISIVLNTTPPLRMVTGLNADRQGSVTELVAELSVALSLVVGGKGTSIVTSPAGFTVLMLPAVFSPHS